MVVLKGKFEKLNTKLDLQLIPYLEIELYNFAYLLNEYNKKTTNKIKKKKKKNCKTCKK